MLASAWGGVKLRDLETADPPHHRVSRSNTAILSTQRKDRRVVFSRMERLWPCSVGVRRGQRQANCDPPGVERGHVTGLEPEWQDPRGGPGASDQHLGCGQRQSLIVAPANSIFRPMPIGPLRAHCIPLVRFWRPRASRTRRRRHRRSRDGTYPTVASSGNLTSSTRSLRLH